MPKEKEETQNLRFSKHVINTYGAIEVDERGDRWWKPILRLSDVITTYDKDTIAKLFDIKNYDKHKPLFARRGLPDDISEEVRAWYQEKRQTSFGESYFYANEIPNLSKMSSEWQIVFFLLKVLGERFGNKNARLVAWFDEHLFY